MNGLKFLGRDKEGKDVRPISSRFKNSGGFLTYLCYFGVNGESAFFISFVRVDKLLFVINIKVITDMKES